MKALIAMSGGVDSSVAAQLMVDKGYECVGCTMRLYDGSFDKSSDNENTKDARSVADKIGIEYRVFDYEKEFVHRVIEPFVREYEAGRTPNPCIECNRYMKFDYLLEEMAKLQCDKIVTGHYVRVAYDEKSGRYLLKKALDASKDQSYVLYMLTQEQLSHTIFPLGEYAKADIRKFAGDHGFVNANKGDSQDICFVPDGDYVCFMERFMNKEYKPGKFVDREGNVLGEHRGFVHYTIGQRHGLGISAAHPLYVVDIIPETNQVVVGKNEDLFKRELIATDVNLISVPEIVGEMRVKARIRYSQKEQSATVVALDDNTIRVTFDEPQRAITKGQAVVMYDGDVVVGGGRIIE